jgi:hypothetical protein
MRNPATGRQCYGGMVPISQLEPFEASEPVPPAEIPEPRTRERELVEESVE